MPDEFTPPPGPPGGTYPLPEPEFDPRLTLGLVVDVAEVLERHGYPRFTALDRADLQQALFRFLYRE